jgi:hypothetical protein
MPEFDGTGPGGKGPMTGRGSGKCIIPLNTTEEELNYLRNQENIMKKQLRSIKTRLHVMETTKTTNCAVSKRLKTIW